MVACVLSDLLGLVERKVALTPTVAELGEASILVQMMIGGELSSKLDMVCLRRLIACGCSLVQGLVPQSQLTACCPEGQDALRNTSCVRTSDKTEIQA
jgi:hypothetical protein